MEITWVFERLSPWTNCILRLNEPTAGKGLGLCCHHWAVGPALELSAFGVLVRWLNWMSLMFVILLTECSATCLWKHSNTSKLTLQRFTVCHIVLNASCVTSVNPDNSYGQVLILHFLDEGTEAWTVWVTSKFTQLESRSGGILELVSLTTSSVFSPWSSWKCFFTRLWLKLCHIHLSWDGFVPPKD